MYSSEPPSGATPQESQTGQWIWLSGQQSNRNTHIYARKIVNLRTRPEKVTVQATADSKYKMYVNGKYVGKGPVRSGTGYVYFDTHDITKFCKRGRNVIAFHVHHFGENTYSYILKKPGLLARVNIHFKNGTIVKGTDETWKVTEAADWSDEGARLSRRLGFQEVYKMENSMSRWNEENYKDWRWQNATVVGKPGEAPWGRLVQRQIPLLAEEIIRPKRVVGTYNSRERTKNVPISDVPAAISETKLAPLKAGKVENAEAILSKGKTVISTPRGSKGVVIVIDFGKEVFGNVEIGLSAEQKSCLDIAYAEELRKDAGVAPDKSGVKYTDRIWLSKGELDWQGFEPRAFRYLQLEFRWGAKPVELRYVRVNQTTYPCKEVGHFSCNDKQLTEIWKVSNYTTQLCMEDAFIDCPWRERAQWWADARIEGRAAYYAFGDTRLLAQGIRQIASSQKDDGSVCGMFPSGEEKMLPDFSLIWVLSIMDYYNFTKDKSLIEEICPVVKGLFDWFEAHENENGLLENVPGWVFIDWGNLEKDGECTALNSIYCRSLQTAAQLCEITGDAENAEKLVARSHRVRNEINRGLFSTVDGLYLDCRKDGKTTDKLSRQSNVLAAWADICDHYRKASICRIGIKSDLEPINTPYFLSYLLDTLYSIDNHEEAVALIRDKYGAMLNAGATTFWEQFNTDHSLCHGWASSPSADLISEIVGIKPSDDPDIFIVEPHIAGLKWAKGTLQTKDGPIKAEWRTGRDAFTLKVTVPGNIKVMAIPPDAPGSVVHMNNREQTEKEILLTSGTHTIRVSTKKQQSTNKSLEPEKYQKVEVLANRNEHRWMLSSRPRRGRPHTSKQAPKTSERTKPRKTAKPRPQNDEKDVKKVNIRNTQNTEDKPKKSPQQNKQTPKTEEKKKTTSRRRGQRNRKPDRGQQPVERKEQQNAPEKDTLKKNDQTKDTSQKSFEATPLKKKFED